MILIILHYKDSKSETYGGLLSDTKNRKPNSGRTWGRVQKWYNPIPPLITDVIQRQSFDLLTIDYVPGSMSSYCVMWVSVMFDIQSLNNLPQFTNGSKPDPPPLHLVCNLTSFKHFLWICHTCLHVQLLARVSIVIRALMLENQIGIAYGTCVSPER